MAPTADPFFVDAPSKASLELRELLLEGQSSSETTAEPSTPPLSPFARQPSFWRRCRRRRLFERPRIKGLAELCTPYRLFLRLLKFLFIFALGSLATILVFTNVDQFGPDEFDQAWLPIGFSGSKYPAEYFRRVIPVPCHSHNDYWRRRPLYGALLTGCISVEADVWLIREKLYVGHSGKELTPNNTLASMYIDPLVGILEEMNKQNSLSRAVSGAKTSQPSGVFYQDPKQSLTLLIDFKTAGPELWPYVTAALEPLRSRGWLTHWDGKSRTTRPITVVGTGDTPFDMVIANNTYRDIFFDAPLEALQSPEDPAPNPEYPIDERGDRIPQRAPHLYKYNPSNSHFASSSMDRALGPLWHFQFTDAQIALMRRQIRQARERGLLPRYWGTPRWPRGLRDEVWTVLLKEGVGLLNVDDLRAVRKGVWGMWPQPSR